jgi:hypothetical protein
VNRIWTGKKGLTAETAIKTIQHIADVFPSIDHVNRESWREYLPHGLKLLAPKHGKIAPRGMICALRLVEAVHCSGITTKTCLPPAARYNVMEDAEKHFYLLSVYGPVRLLSSVFVCFFVGLIPIIVQSFIRRLFLNSILKSRHRP